MWKRQGAGIVHFSGRVSLAVGSSFQLLKKNNIRKNDRLLCPKLGTAESPSDFHMFHIVWNVWRSGAEGRVNVTDIRVVRKRDRNIKTLDFQRQSSYIAVVARETRK